MNNEQIIELLTERLVERTNKANETFLRNIGQKLKQIKKLSPKEAQQLVQMLKYGENFDEITSKISEYANLNIKDIDDIFSNYAKKDQLFYEKFYKYRNIPFTPFEENKALKTQTKALANIVKNEMYNYFRTNVLGYTIHDTKGNLIFKGLRDTYNELLDTALLNVGQGKETFDSAMSKILKEIGQSGLKTLNYESGRNIRVDSAIRMHLQDKLKELHNENQKIYGQEFGADGVEISVHENPAPDHTKVQGRQFSINQYDEKGKLVKEGEFEKLQAGMVAKDYKGVAYTLDHDGKNGYRPISEMNCYHYIFTIVLGVSEPEYTDKELSQIKERNEKGFRLYDKRSGKEKKYTMYEGTQLQRNLERKIREQKDIQILAKESGNDNLVLESQNKITQLTRQYKQLSEVSGLPTKMDRLRVPGYKRTKVKKGE